jgi:hypothetical protein
MALYFTSNTNITTPSQQNLAATSKTMAGVWSKAAASGVTLSRAFIYEFEVGADGTPNATDCAIAWDIQACTTTGTAVTMNVQPLDPADAATSHDNFSNATAEGTTTANSQRWALAANQRASYRWVVNPGGPGELVVIATASNGLIVRAKSPTYASTAQAAIYFRE